MSLNFFEQQLAKQKQQGRYRQRIEIENNGGRYIHVNGERYLNFSSNDYLGFNGHPDINDAFKKGIDKYGSSSCSSSLITGFSSAHAQLEELLSDWFGVEKCLLFTSGFAANSGLLNALAIKNSHFILDKLSHASLLDGAQQAQAQSQAKHDIKFSRFNHNSLDHLQRKLAQDAEHKLVVTESVFSMDGDCAPLSDIAQLAHQANSQLLIDEAHGVGVFGEAGEGCTANLAKDNVIIMATFGKALASSGAVIAGSEALIDYLVNYCRHYIYTTAMAPAQACATIASVKLAQKESWRRERLNALRESFISQLDPSLTLTESQSAIIGIIIGDEHATVTLSEKLKKLGIWLSAIRPPTIQKGTSRLRVTLTCHHNQSDINYLAEAINKLAVS